MREILFRGKRTDTKEWVEGMAFPHDNDRVTMFSQHSVDGVLTGEEVDPETVGQFTGLTDKNNKKIFEGDIIQNVTEGKTAVVQWFSEHSAFMLWCKSENQVYWLYDNDFLNIEVIGNIYDNPELLGGVKPCPFCGGEATLVSSPFDYSCQVRCTKCGAETREIENTGFYFTTYYANRIEAVELWNKRAGESE